MNAIRLKLTIAYDGTNFQGWQVQKVGLGVQELIEKAIASIFQEQVRVHGSSRTDTGVHARAMIAHFDLPRANLKMPVLKIPLALNGNLPEDIRIMDAQEVSNEFHARFSAVSRAYRYLVGTDEQAESPFRRDRELSWRKPLDRSLT